MQDHLAISKSRFECLKFNYLVIDLGKACKLTKTVNFFMNRGCFEDYIRIFTFLANIFICAKKKFVNYATLITV